MLARSSAPNHYVVSGFASEDTANYLRHVTSHVVPLGAKTTGTLPPAPTTNHGQEGHVEKATVVTPAMADHHCHAFLRPCPPVAGRTAGINGTSLWQLRSTDMHLANGPCVVAASGPRAEEAGGFDGAPDDAEQAVHSQMVMDRAGPTEQRISVVVDRCDGETGPTKRRKLAPAVTVEGPPHEARPTPSLLSALRWVHSAAVTMVVGTVTSLMVPPICTKAGGTSRDGSTKGYVELRDHSEGAVLVEVSGSQAVVLQSVRAGDIVRFTALQIVSRGLLRPTPTTSFSRLETVTNIVHSPLDCRPPAGSDPCLGAVVPTSCCWQSSYRCYKHVQMVVWCSYL